VDVATQFEDFDDFGCFTANFACVATGQRVEVDLRLMAGGLLLAKKVEAEDNDNEEEFEGIITRINSPAQFEMVLLERLSTNATFGIGQLIVVNLLNGTQFRIDDDNLTVNSADFDAASDLMVGQMVEIKRRSAPSGTPPAVDTDRVKLKFSRFTATVVSVDVVNNQFVVNNLPGLLASQGITQLTIRVSPSRTNFNNVANLSGLATGNTVGVRALLFSGSGIPFGVAGKIRKR
jgi:hypothetical protein